MVYRSLLEIHAFRKNFKIFFKRPHLIHRACRGWWQAVRKIVVLSHSFSYELLFLLLLVLLLLFLLLFFLLLLFLLLCCCCCCSILGFVLVVIVVGVCFSDYFTHEAHDASLFLLFLVPWLVAGVLVFLPLHRKRKTSWKCRQNI